MSWTVVASASDIWAFANRNDYVEVDYVVDFYVDDNHYTVVASASTTWTDAS